MTEKLHIGIIGCGGIAHRHFNALMKHEQAELSAICDLQMEQMDRLLGEVDPFEGPEPARYGNEAEMYCQENLQGVVICTPHAVHFNNVIKALDAGLYVLVEKPMVTTVKHALEIRKKVRETGKILAIGYKTPAMASFKHLRKIISDRRFGRLQLINGYLCQDWLNNTRGMWRQDPLVSGGGQAYDSGAHILNSLTWSVKSIPTEVYAMIYTCGLEVDVNSVIAVRFENGVLANIAIGGNTASKGGSGGTHMVYLFERGRVEIDGWRGSWIEVFDEKGPVELDADSLRSELPTNNFVAAILGLEEPATDVEDGVLQSLLMESLYRSAQTGTVIRPKVRHLP